MKTHLCLVASLLAFHVMFGWPAQAHLGPQATHAIQRIASNFIHVDARRISAQQMQINWQVDDLREVAFFTVERSHKGLPFELVGGFRLQLGEDRLTFSFSDLVPYTDDNVYYRVKQIHRDGSFIYSEPVLPHVDVPFSILPDQAGAYHLVFDQPADRSVSVDIFDHAGHHLMHHALPSAAARFALPLDTYAAGIYYVSISDGSIRWHQRLLKR
ncbi:MAG: hypothetical protein OHK0039_06550 [Bacteroidia bacterium]